MPFLPLQLFPRPDLQVLLPNSKQKSSAVQTEPSRWLAERAVPTSWLFRANGGPINIPLFS